ncbi:dimethylhistidine N-methyltransferase [Filimonas zeae]|uniref:Dimethylhistidine N-methyltransferase n=1 Tax=Filimonas zeae TaxID=1737353 RepID=A0A917MTM8_9BACT|nr:L-histidine N(alpha)-methyltransferase [Filimonas zeae]MDR6337723.1 dimethylhistidine N-methyltransferase [Filimonas zeae]GGH59953.1 dimethylhistidine N-methyltransferase [Filimonas zeae]
MYTFTESYMVPQAAQKKSALEEFRRDVLEGLNGSVKKLQSKYFYDKEGDRLFQQIMNCPEYYVTNCELEIFQQQTELLARMVIADGSAFDLIELGAGDATKSQYLLQHLINAEVPFTYMPIDISGNILSELEERLSSEIPALRVRSLEGDYFEMLQKAVAFTLKRKVVLLLGANIGNMAPQDALEFARRLRAGLQPGDRVVIGVDLKKHPRVIREAYDDREGITARFNLNLLARINRELKADFDIAQFEHYQHYDPDSGACKSYLVSLCNQVITIGKKEIPFAKDETIYMEISQKYTLNEVAMLAADSGFIPVSHCTDSKGWFVDACWVAG